MARDDPAGTALERGRSPAEILQAECLRLEGQVDAQALEIKLLRGRFARYESAIRGSHVVVYTQDPDLRYTSISHGLLGLSVDDILGRNDDVRGGGIVGHWSGGDLRPRRSKIQPVVRHSFVFWTKGSRRDVCRGGLRGRSAICFQ